MKPQQDITETRLKSRVCPKCRFENAVDAKYCVRCGSPMDIQEAMQMEDASKRVRAAIAESFKDPKVIEEMVHEYLMQQKEERAKKKKGE